MKKESYDEWKARTGKEPTKLKITDSNLWGFEWLVKGNVKLKTKGKKT